MQICTGIDLIRQQVSDWKAQQATVAFVPTMGNLHAGHMELVKQARNSADHVVVSIFVNPLQFNEAADFELYPRTLEDDVNQLQAELWRCIYFLVAVDTIYITAGVTLFEFAIEE